MPNYQPIIPPELQSEEEKKLLAERERNEVKLTYHKNRLKALKHEEAQLERKTRNHRIFTRGAMLESFLLKPTLLTDDQRFKSETQRTAQIRTVCRRKLHLQSHHVTPVWQA